MDDFISLQTTTKNENAAKQAGIEKLGEIVRRLAIDGHDNSDKDQADSASVEDSEDNGSDDTDAGKQMRPRKKRRKITKREKTGPVDVHYSGAIQASAQSEQGKLALEAERLKLEQLESDRRAVNDAAMHKFMEQMGAVMVMFIQKS